MTKLFLKADRGTSLADLELQIEEGILQSLERLQIDRIPAVLLHRQNVLGIYGAMVTELLLKHVKRGHVCARAAGLFVYSSHAGDR
ncbi:hypothetical protein D3C72_2263750 [compost metagenome]